MKSDMLLVHVRFNDPTQLFGFNFAFSFRIHSHEINGSTQQVALINPTVCRIA